jgi:hypothetical protein
MEQVDFAPCVFRLNNEVLQSVGEMPVMGPGYGWDRMPSDARVSLQRGLLTVAFRVPPWQDDPGRPVPS